MIGGAVRVRAFSPSSVVVGNDAVVEVQCPSGEWMVLTTPISVAIRIVPNELITATIEVLVQELDIEASEVVAL